MRETLLKTCPFAVAFFASGIAFGIAALGVGLDAISAAVMSAVAFSGTAQLTALQQWTDPPPILAICIAAFSVNARYIALAASVAERTGKISAARAAAIGLLTDASWLLTVRSEGTPMDAWRIFLISSALLWPAWILGTLLGGLWGECLDGLWLGLAAFSALALLAAAAGSMIEHRQQLLPAVVGLGVAFALDPLLPGSWHVLLGGAVGGLVGTLRHE